MSYKQNQLNDLNRFLQLDDIDEEDRAPWEKDDDQNQIKEQDPLKESDLDFLNSGRSKNKGMH